MHLRFTLVCVRGELNMAEIETKYDEDSQYEELAKDYSLKKTDTILNIIRMGKLIFQAKQRLSHGYFEKWLKDKRVSESLRTSQRLMQIFHNYRHLISQSADKANKLSNLGLMKMLELNHLPDTFRKSVEIEEEGHKEVVDVIDEDKLDTFLKRQVKVGDKYKPIKDLSLSQLKQKVKEENPASNPVLEAEVTGDVTEETQDATEYLVSSRENFSDILQLSSQCVEMREHLVKYDEAKLITLSEDDKVKLKTELNSLKSKLEALIVKINDINGGI